MARPRRSHSAAVALATLALLGGAASCSDGSDDAASTVATLATVPLDSSTSDAPTSTIDEDADVTTALTARLTEEFGDADLAATVVGGLTPEVLTTLDTKLSAQEIMTTPALAYLPTETADEVDSLVVLAFGNRIAPDGTTSAGPTNEALADAVAAYVAEHPMPVYAQWEVAEILQANDVPDVVSIEPVVAADGTVTYLSTSGVTDQIVAQASAAGVDLGTVGVVGFADHVVRCVMTAQTSGMDAAVVEGLELPTEYDPESGQEWTRNRASYLSVDLSSRLAAL